VLEASRRISVAVAPPADAPEDECAPVASPVDAERLRACADEHDLVAAITPLLCAARGFGDVVEAQGPPDPCASVLSAASSRRGSTPHAAGARRLPATRAF
jgi:hypothetical protein